ncbi:hypothetical protein TNCT_657361 [Trichonephila clavata]|uniref:Uncharacterized protein n=1 Tax=Trichonephila clavata TaxID=2740835 RepID=A0A8X6JAB6_TRICU|nr:hypothetical protein TNCT_657361 [Trichonephila clavata]
METFRKMQASLRRSTQEYAGTLPQRALLRTCPLGASGNRRNYGISGLISHQDNALPHTARIAENFPLHVQTLSKSTGYLDISLYSTFVTV